VREKRSIIRLALFPCGRFHAAEHYPELPQNSRVLVMSLAVFFWNV
jgi:hypothetical protein